MRSFYSAGFGQSIIEMLGLLLFSLGYLSVECLFVLVLCFFFFLLAQRDKFAGPLASYCFVVRWPSDS